MESWEEKKDLREWNFASGSLAGAASGASSDSCAGFLEGIGFGVPPLLSLDSWTAILLGLSNLMPMSRDVQLQYPQTRIQGPLMGVPSESNVFTVMGAVQIGQLKQFLLHLWYGVS